MRFKISTPEQYRRKLRHQCDKAIAAGDIKKVLLIIDRHTEFNKMYKRLNKKG